MTTAVPQCFAFLSGVALSGSGGGVGPRVLGHGPEQQLGKWAGPGASCVATVVPYVKRGPAVDC